MPAYALSSSSVSTTTPKLKKGSLRIYTTESVYWCIGENPVADDQCAILRAGDEITLRLPVNCSKLAVLAVNAPGAVSAILSNGGAKSSCA